MELFCEKCELVHSRPVGRRCNREGMATNTPSTQPTVAPNAFLTQQLTGRPPSPIEGTSSGTSVIRDGSTSLTVASTTSAQQSPRTEELILAELQKLSSRMTLVEQELQADTFTSTPRRRKRVRAAGQGEDSSLVATGNRTDIHNTLEESTSVPRRTGGVRIPVHTHSNTSTTTTTVSSLFALSGQRSGQYTTVNVSQLGHTQTVFSTCQSAHQYSHVRTVQQGAPLLRTQGLPQSTIGSQSVRLANTRPNGPTDPHRMPTTTSTHNVTFNPIISSTTYLGHNSTGLHHQPHAYQPTQPTLIPPPNGATMMPQTHQQQQNITGQHTAATVVNQDQPIIPSIQALRTTAVNQDLVQQRLQQLNQYALPQQPGNLLSHNLTPHTTPVATSKPKTKKEKIEVTWPQDCAFVGHLRARVTYDQLTQAQFILGFLRLVQEESDMYVRSNMIEYLTELFQNVCDHSWQAAKGAHLVVMTKMEEGLITWNDLKKVNKVRKTYVNSNSTSHSSQGESSNSSHNKKGNRKPSSVPCKDYNDGRCSRMGDHEQGLITHKHVCAYCMYTFSRLYNHPETQCNNKRRKNGHGGPQQ